ncbi:MAG: nucleoside/nucleotide kinase family protein [Albidovulum sp.]|nr:nucleoside/nucleotide kinase family protein [Albidovulum sp.]
MNKLELLRYLEGLPHGRRTIVAIAGPPGSGKSTLATRAKEHLNLGNSGRAEILPMDGFHFDDRLLEKMGRLARKGAPDTFDVDGLCCTLRRLSEERLKSVAIPVFDRDLEIARAGARIIEDSTEIVIAEGNYLLCTDAPWAKLHKFFDLTVMIEVPEQELRRRLRNRWVSYGLDSGEVQRHLDDNDLPNGRFVSARSKRADIVYRQDSNSDAADESG